MRNTAHESQIATTSPQEQYNFQYLDANFPIHIALNNNMASTYLQILQQMDTINNYIP